MNANEHFQKMRAALEDSPELFRDFVEVIPTTATLFVDRCLTYINQAGQKLLEADDRADLIGLPLSTLIHPIDLSRAEAHFRRSETNSDSNQSIEIRILTLKGNLRLLTTTGAPVHYKGTHAIFVIAMDITHHQVIEQQLLESERHFRRLFENMQDVYYRTDASGTVQLVGPGVRSVLGYEPEEIMGHTAEAYYPNPSDRDALKSAIRENGSVADFSGQMVRKDGRIIDISISSRALYEEDGTFAGVEGIYRDVTERKMLERELRRLATTDSLTGIANRRAFLEQANGLLHRYQRYSTMMVLFMLDLDYFKSINDLYGHIAGDAVLCIFVDTVQKELRDTDLFGRLGGEEFCILLQECQREKALHIAERLCALIAATDLTAATGKPSTLTVSIGITANHPADSTIEHLIARADRALYEAKVSGRNHVVWHSK